MLNCSLVMGGRIATKFGTVHIEHSPPNPSSFGKAAKCVWIGFDDANKRSIWDNFAPQTGTSNSGLDHHIVIAV